MAKIQKYNPYSKSKIITMKEDNISEHIERYFDCPKCQAFISDYGNEFDKTKEGYIKCPSCRILIKIS